jgi:WD40 repeat protein
VYRARQLKFNRLVALKMVLTGSHASEADLARFLAEAEAVAQLQHHNIVQLFDADQHAGLPYFTMEFISGGCLAERLRGTPWPPSRSAALVEQLARGVHAAHEHGIIHRDLKPANVLLTLEETPKLTDFGLARRLAGGSGLTATGAVLGTPAYMAPEQAEGKGKQVGPPADIYALGAILYECLTGRPPFQGPTPLETLAQLVSDDPVQPRRLQPKIPADLETICLKCLQKEPVKRYASALELAADLQRFQAGETIQARPASPGARAARWVRRRPAAAALVATIVVAVLALLGGATWFTLQLNDARLQAEELARTEKQARDAERKARDEAENQAEQARFNQYVVQMNLVQRDYEANNIDRVRELLEVQIPKARATDLRDFEWHYWKCLSEEKLPPEPLTLKGHTGEVTSVAFSPDGRRLASASEDGTVRVWDSATGQELLTLKGGMSRVTCVAFSPDGSRLASASHDQTVRIWDSATGKELRTLKGHTGWVRGVAFSPDGSHLASASDDQTVRVWDCATGRELLVLEGHTSWVTGVCFSPDGSRLASASDDQTVQVRDSATGQQLLSVPGHTSTVTGVTFSPRYLRLASASYDQTVRIWDGVTGQELLALKGHSAAVSCVSFSPDGRRLASAGHDQTVRVWDSATGQELLTLKGQTSGVTSVAFSPDGRRLASANYDHTVRVWEAVPVSATVLQQREVVSQVRALFDEFLIKEEVLAALRKDTTLGDSDRAFALQVAEAYPGESPLLNQAAWAVVQSKHATQEAYALALRRAEIAARLAPEDGSILTTLGVAQYRIGQHAEAVATLLKADKLSTPRYEGSHMANLAFLAMAQHQLGHREQAQATFGRLKGSMKQPHGAKHDRARAFLREAEELSQIKPAELSDLAWQVVKTPGRDQKAYDLAVQQAATAAQAAPKDGFYRIILGVAQYRAGQFAAAVESLTNSQKLNDIASPTDLAFLAMAQHQLGKKDEAKTTLARLREAMKQPRWANNAEAQGFLREAEEFIEGKSAGKSH